MNIGKNIKALRQMAELTQDELGRKLDVSGKTVSSWEINRTEPNMGMVQKMSEIFNCTKEAIISDWKIEQPKPKGVKIHVLGRVQAGVPIEAIENIIGDEEITEEMARQGEYFGLQIKGDSMSPRFLEGDVVIVRKQSDIESGDIGIVLVDGTDATVKRVMKHDNGMSLVAFNHSYPPRFLTCDEVRNLPVEILGKVVELRGKFE